MFRTGAMRTFILMISKLSPLLTSRVVKNDLPSRVLELGYNFVRELEESPVYLGGDASVLFVLSASFGKNLHPASDGTIFRHPARRHS